MRKLIGFILALMLVVGVTGCNDKEIKKSVAIARTAMFIAIGTGSPSVGGLTPASYDADALLKPTAEALVRLAFAKDPEARGKVAEIATFVLGGMDDGTFITLDDAEWAILESIPQEANPLWSALVFTLGRELRDLAAKRGLTEDRIRVDVRAVLGMVVRISKE